jgi:hypothetical protein
MSDLEPGSPAKPRKIGVYDRPPRTDLKSRAVPIALAIAAALAGAGILAAVV